MGDKISVIVPLYNAASYMERGIGSLLGQTHGDLELLLIDDGSIDESLALARRMAEADPRVVLLTQEHQGVAAARNKGLQAATGDYLTFLDADDWLDADALERLLALIQQNEADAVFFNSVNEEGKPRVAAPNTGVTDATGLVREMLCYEDENGHFSGYYMSLWNKLFRVSALRAAPGGLGQFDPAIPLLEDGVWLMEHAPCLQKGVLEGYPHYHKLTRETDDGLAARKQREKDFAAGTLRVLQLVSAMGDEANTKLSKEAYLRSLHRLVLLGRASEDAQAEMDALLASVGAPYRDEFLTRELLRGGRGGKAVAPSAVQEAPKSEAADIAAPSADTAIADEPPTPRAEAARLREPTNGTLIQQVRYKIQKNSFLFEELVKRDFKKKYKRTSLGMLWSVLNPLLTLLVMSLVFTQFFGRTMNHYTIYMFSGNLLFSYFRESTVGGMSSLVSNASIFSKVNIPKYMFLLSRNVSSLINFLLTLCIYFVFVIADGLPIAPRFIMLIYPVVCMVAFNIGMGLILSALNVFYRDTHYFYDIFTLLLMYLSAIFYSVDGSAESLRVHQVLPGDRARRQHSQPDVPRTCDRLRAAGGGGGRLNV